jgi:hypothetical protein
MNWRAYHAVDLGAPELRYVDKRADATGGLDAKVVIKDSLVLDVAANPDFAQVESDEPQIITNRRFEVFFPEKRPFFTENGNYFDAPMADENRLLFTRRIADPDFGARLTGKLKRFSIGALFADDRAPGQRLPLDDPRLGGRASFSAVRISRDLPKQANVAAMYVERRWAGSFNRVVDLDGTFRLGNTWAATLLVANSWTEDATESIASRSDLEARINRQGRGFNYNLQFVDTAPDFNAQTGFIFRTDNRYVTQDSSYTFWPRAGPVTNVKAGLRVEKGWFVRGGDSYATAAPAIAVQLNHQTTIEVYSVQWHDVLRPIDYAALPRDQSFREMSYAASASSSQLRWLRFNWRFDRGTRLHYIPSTGHAPGLAEFSLAQCGFSLRPTRGLSIDHTYLFDRNRDRLTGESMYSSHVLRAKTNWQLSREVSARVIAQYEALLADPRFTSTPTARGFNADFLFTYLAHPGTAIYVGYNSSYSRPAIEGSAVDAFVNDGRQFFVKASYLLRF